MRDIFGNKLMVGDIVAFNWQGTLITATIDTFGAFSDESDYVQLAFFKGNELIRYREPPSRVAKNVTEETIIAGRNDKKVVPYKQLVENLKDFYRELDSAESAVVGTEWVMNKLSKCAFTPHKAPEKEITLEEQVKALYEKVSTMESTLRINGIYNNSSGGPR